VQSPSKLLTRLNLETRSLHPEADALWVELLAPDVTLDGYEHALTLAYGFEAPIEAALALTRGVASVLALRGRGRSGLLVEDLLGLGYPPARIARLPQCSQIVPFRDPAEALGWLYVVERSTLLHESVKRHLQRVLPRVRTWSYLSAYEGHAGRAWVELGQALDQLATSRDIEDEIIAASRDAFATQRQWTSLEVSRSLA
jgi:heme oxygenase